MTLHRRSNHRNLDIIDNSFRSSKPRLRQGARQLSRNACHTNLVNHRIRHTKPKTPGRFTGQTDGRQFPNPRDRRLTRKFRRVKTLNHSGGSPPNFTFFPRRVRHFNRDREVGGVRVSIRRSRPDQTRRNKRRAHNRNLAKTRTLSHLVPLLPGPSHTGRTRRSNQVSTSTPAFNRVRKNSLTLKNGFGQNHRAPFSNCFTRGQAHLPLGQFRRPTFTTPNPAGGHVYLTQPGLRQGHPPALTPNSKVRFRRKQVNNRRIVIDSLKG